MATIVLNPTELTIKEGEVGEISPTVSPEGSIVEWTSSNPEIATVENGKVTALKAGTVTITAKVVEGEPTE